MSKAIDDISVTTKIDETHLSRANGDDIRTYLAHGEVLRGAFEREDISNFKKWSGVATNASTLISTKQMSPGLNGDND
jgi:hypothetical protein